MDYQGYMQILIKTVDCNKKSRVVCLKFKMYWVIIVM